MASRCDVDRQEVLREGATVTSSRRDVTPHPDIHQSQEDCHLSAASDETLLGKWWARLCPLSDLLSSLPEWSERVIHLGLSVCLSVCLSGRETKTFLLRLTWFLYTRGIYQWLGRLLRWSWSGSGSGLKNLFKDSSSLGDRSRTKYTLKGHHDTKRALWWKQALCHMWKIDKKIVLEIFWKSHGKIM